MDREPLLGLRSDNEWRMLLRQHGCPSSEQEILHYVDNMCEAAVMADEFARKAKKALAEVQKAADRADELRLTAIDMRGIADVACERVLRFRAMCASCTARGEDRLRLIRVTLRVYVK